MSKCRDTFIAHYELPTIGRQLSDPLNPYHFAWLTWQAAWKARGKVDKEICEKEMQLVLADAIEQEDEK